MKARGHTREREHTMLRIAICCGGGFSSSTMAAHLNRQLEEKGLQDEVDVALCCPHLEFPAKDATKQGKLRIPVFILPMRLYGQINIEQVVEEAEDVLELWNNGVPNPIVFPDEPRSMTATRNVSHRRWLAQQKK